MSFNPFICGCPPRLRFVEQPEAAPANRVEKRHPEVAERRLLAQAGAARYFAVSERTIRIWVDRGFVTGYLKGKALWVDIDEIEAQFATNKSMRDGRRSRFSTSATLRPFPSEAN